jgi:uncharacterized repeat protein (TIGR03803 family)
VFAIKTDGMGFQTVYSFPTTGAGFSWAGLVLSGKTLYGTTRDGGTGGAGTVFALNADGTGFTTLHNFTSTPNGTNADGAHPYSTLALSDGTLYGTTDEGGSGFLGTVFALQTDGSGFRTLHSFSATSGSSGAYGTNSDGADSYAGVILSGDTLYGAAHSGGAAGYGTAFKLRTDGTGFSVLHTFGEGAIFDSAPDGDLLFFGNTLYGATRGGSFGSSEIFSIALPVIPPQLTLVAGGRNVVLAWPTNTGGFDYSGYTLQSSTNLGPAAAWVTNSVQPVVANGKFMVTNPISGAKQFYRLAQ